MKNFPSKWTLDKIRTLFFKSVLCYKQIICKKHVLQQWEGQGSGNTCQTKLVLVCLSLSSHFHVKFIYADLWLTIRADRNPEGVEPLLRPCPSVCHLTADYILITWRCHVPLYNDWNISSCRTPWDSTWVSWEGEGCTTRSMTNTEWR